MKSIVTVTGARPQFVKASVVSRALKASGIPELLVHTGQHYDAAMSSVFFEELGLPEPAFNFGVGSGPHGAQTAEILRKTEALLLERLDQTAALMVYGDTNSTLAATLAAAKLHVPVIHVEAGLRSFNREMPEEVNRVLTDQLSSLLFCSSETGAVHLRNEGITAGVHISGDVMQDAVRIFSGIANQKGDALRLEPLDDGDSFMPPKKAALLTVHRPSNTDVPENMQSILEGIADFSGDVIWPVHPRNRHHISGLPTPRNLRLVKPLPYLSLLRLLSEVSIVLTDSGGLQKEAYWLRKPCITLREETEWVETLEGGWNQLTGPDASAIRSALDRAPAGPWVPLYGDGQAATYIAQTIKTHFKL
ncbi:UDP-GlcNAc3NAcA epimerase [Cyclonatronum proteinivorum]|uniref:UDP-GlcNAc3NAcA epimerase n=1 Tax=Cyclonatronum proteinivorum TaxID=1457365 RepID=A0A345UNA6_9BACT|nr:UDP-N-acetylglucosamine 2-epimerase (non-hydrolyzing) [Cyclonatronum proteinivorum]AXJ01958.1 UDP-GlcNAc3NAcA epimerase [Cyclonatronum proteinivorum]